MIEAGRGFVENSRGFTLWLFNITMENCPFIDDVLMYLLNVMIFSMDMLVITTMNHHENHGLITIKSQFSYGFPMVFQGFSMLKHADSRDSPAAKNHADFAISLSGDHFRHDFGCSDNPWAIP